MWAISHHDEWVTMQQVPRCLSEVEEVLKYALFSNDPIYRQPWPLPPYSQQKLTLPERDVMKELIFEWRRPDDPISCWHLISDLLDLQSKEFQ